MARRTWSELAALLADNSSGEISEADLRDAVIDSAQPHVEARPPTSTDDTTGGFDVGHTWIDTSASPMPEAWRCVVSTPSAAIWSRIEGAKGDPGDPGLSWEGAWDDTTTYALGAVVRHAGSVWVANTGNTNKEPGVDAEWDVLAEDGAAGTPGADGTPRWMGAWSAGSYAAGDAVTHGGSSYVANASTTQEPPHADWDVFAAKGADGGGASAFTDLTDAPSSYSGEGGKYVAVNSGATALEFVDAPSGGGIQPAYGLVVNAHGSDPDADRETAAVNYWIGDAEPNEGEEGDLWLDTTGPTLHFYADGAWHTTGSGGGDGWAYQVFTTSGTWDWDGAGEPDTVDVLVLAGGGGGGSFGTFTNGAGGGGAGGLRIEDGVTVTGDETVIVGAGGTAGSSGTGGTGGNSSFGSITALGGGGGEGYGGGVYTTPGSGGSGGGAAGSASPRSGGGGTAGQGHAGGSNVSQSGSHRPGGGGGGAAAVGADTTNGGAGAAGGAGVALATIGWGDAESYGAPAAVAGGGGGGDFSTGGGAGGFGGGGAGSNAGAGSAGTANTGGGGGGGGGSAGALGGAGGSGLVIVRWQTP